MKSVKTEVPFKNTLGDILKSRKILNKYSQAGFFLKAFSIAIRIFLLCITLYGLLFYFKEYYFLRKIAYSPLPESIGCLILGMFLFAVFAAEVFYFTTLKNCKIKMHFKKNAYKNRTRLLTAGDGGITLSTVYSSRHFEWDKVTLLTEISDGLLILFSDEYVFVPSRFISAVDIKELRNLFLEYISSDKINFISRVSLKAEPEKCEDFKVIDLVGNPIKQMIVDGFSFDDYLHIKLTDMLYFNPDIRIFKGVIVLFVLIYTIFTVKNIWLGLLCFIAIFTVLLVIDLFLIYLYIRRCYEKSEKGSRRITFYSNAIYIETANSFSVLEYKNILSYQEKTYSIVVVGYDTIFRISREKAKELEKIKELIKRKTINNDLT